MSTACDTGAVDKRYELWTNTAPILGPPPGRGSTNPCCRLAVSRLSGVRWSPSSRQQGVDTSLPRRAAPVPARPPAPAPHVSTMKLAAVDARFVAVNLMIDAKFRWGSGPRSTRARPSPGSAEILEGEGPCGGRFLPRSAVGVRADAGRGARVGGLLRSSPALLTKEFGAGMTCRPDTNSLITAGATGRAVRGRRLGRRGRAGVRCSA